MLIVAVVALATTTAILPGTAAAAPDRREPCAEAWQVISEQSPSLASGAPDAWNHVTDAFLSFADASFDGPLSNAFGDVASAADAVATSLQTGGTEGALTARFHSALGALGTTCAQLATTRHRDTVARFQRFTYQTGFLTGLPPESGARANASVNSMVQRAVRAARRANRGQCTGGSARCGYFIETLHQRPCVTGMVCVLMKNGLLPVGANSSEGTVETLPVDALTGQSVPFSRVIPSDSAGPFLDKLNAAVLMVLRNGGIVDLAFWKPHMKLTDVSAWLPQPDGLHVWFDKYAVAPGSFGVVEVVVPWPAAGGSAQA